eukprot:SAG22_NODE_1513_length_4254_cov_10.073887_5_plen_156_part_00
MAFVIAVPKNKTLQGGAGRDRLNQISAVDQFTIPALKIGTYDKLVQLSDDLEKVTVTVESTTARLYKQMIDSRCGAGGDWSTSTRAPIWGPKGGGGGVASARGRATNQFAPRKFRPGVDIICLGGGVPSSLRCCTTARGASSQPAPVSRSPPLSL